ncbi:protein Flattop [Venturia canescens]|uniref:protein Flattop n=1 Tax=Venturia canescens TaxID=32260 RepID=UPI001C9CB05A|nr:protein Flattop-like [Venturia canescens]
MSQFWHANWAEDTFKPHMLGNWEVPNWHPRWPCWKHCRPTTFLTDNSGHILPDKPRSKRSPWGDYKGTWQLPKRISREMANKLSDTQKHKRAAWEAHKKHYAELCSENGATNSKKKTKSKAKEAEIVEKTTRASLGFGAAETPVPTKNEEQQE